MNHALDRLHDRDPGPLNPHYRPGFKEAIEHAYTAYCDNHPDATPSQLKQEYQNIVDRLRDEFPTFDQPAPNHPTDDPAVQKGRHARAKEGF